MEAAPSGPGLPKWNTFNYGMVCFYSIGLHASISLPYYMVKYSGKWGMHAVEGGFFCWFFSLPCLIINRRCFREIGDLVIADAESFLVAKSIGY